MARAAGAGRLVIGPMDAGAAMAGRAVGVAILDGIDAATPAGRIGPWICGREVGVGTDEIAETGVE